jgi:putative hydrolase of the HAD superfamily
VLRAVAFDLDDTLAVTARDRETLLRRAAERAGVGRPIDREDYLDAHREHSGTESRRPVFDALVDGDPGPVTRAYREAVGEALEPVPGAVETVVRLGKRYRVGLLTDGPEETQRDKLRRLGWSDAFDAVVVTGAVDAPKPAPEAFEALREALDAERGEIAYVGDDPELDVAGAADAGLVPVQVVYDGGPETHPAAAGTVRREELSGLPAVLEEVGGDGADHA